MIKIKRFLPIILIIYIHSNPTIDFTNNLNSGKGLTIEGDNIILQAYPSEYNNIYGEYSTNFFKLIGTGFDKSIIVPLSSTLYIEGLTLASTGKLTPLRSTRGQYTS